MHAVRPLVSSTLVDVESGEGLFWMGNVSEQWTMFETTNTMVACKLKRIPPKQNALEECIGRSKETQYCQLSGVEWSGVEWNVRRTESGSA